MPTGPSVCQAPSGDLNRIGSQPCDLLATLRRAIEDAGWTEAALSQHLDTDRSYINRMLNGEKPLSLDRLARLPREIVARFGVLVAESAGAVVLMPSSRDDAVKHLLEGLLGILERQPMQPRMVKADWDGRERRRTA